MASAAVWCPLLPITTHHHSFPDNTKKLPGLVSHISTGTGSLSLKGLSCSRVLGAGGQVNMFQPMKDYPVSLHERKSLNGDSMGEASVYKALWALELAVQRGEKPDIVEATDLLYDFCRMKRPDKGARVLELMVMSGLNPRPSTFTVLVDELCKRGKVWDAMQLVEKMEKYGYSANAITYNSLIKGLCVFGNLDKCLLMFDKFVKKGLQPNVYTYSLLLEAACKKRGVDVAERLLEEIIAKGGHPNSICYNIVLTGFCNEGKVEEALRFFRGYPSRGFKPDVVSYNILLRAFCRQGRWNEAYELLAEMNEEGVEPSLITWNVLVSSLSLHRRVDNALEVLDEMSSLGVEANTETYNPIIAQLCKEGKMEQMLKCLNDMFDRGCDPNMGTYNAIAGLCECGMVHEAFSIIQSLSSKQNSSIHDYYNRVIELLCWKGNTYSAFRLLDKMTERGFVPSTYTYSSLMKGLCSERMFSAAIEIFEIMDDTEYARLIDWNPLVTGLCRVKRTDLSLDFVQMMMNKRYKINETTYRIIVEGIFLEGEKELAAELLSELYLRRVVSLNTVERIKLKHDLEGLSEINF